MTAPDADLLNFLADVLAKAKSVGADAADVLMAEGHSISVAQRLGRPERLERSEGYDLGLRVFIGRRQAIVSGNDRRPEAVSELVERAVAMARVAPEDAFCGIADPDQITHQVPDLDICDWTEPETATLVDRARAAEEAALAVSGVTNSEGAEAGWGLTRIALAATNGFAGAYARSSHSVSVSALAGSGTGMERDYDYSSTVHGADLDDPAAVGRRAGERAVRRLNPRKAATAKVPVIIDQRLAGGLLRSFAGAINGSSIARGTSFLKDRMGDRIFPQGINIVDDALQPRGLASKPFDAEGLASGRTLLVQDGVLKSWVLDLYAARKLGLSSTGHASRGTGGPPSPSTTNLYLEPGRQSPAELIREIGQGLLVTEMIGTGVNLLTGDYSRGAAGFWIERGEIAYPVSEITVAGNLKDMFLALTAADDLVFRAAVNAPTLMIEGMTVAGR
ncbi:PmbA protein [Constrictibacter sp. MBR-5]|jgi:PmbA protein|uniref:TldD/PmbA family protein n=1 Tax=Constrictibacter sp. MBR-5 TaxID=3156467 RepID=UPI003397EF0C